MEWQKRNDKDNKEFGASYELTVKPDFVLTVIYKQTGYTLHCKRLYLNTVPLKAANWEDAQREAEGMIVSEISKLAEFAKGLRRRKLVTMYADEFMQIPELVKEYWSRHGMDSSPNDNEANRWAILNYYDAHTNELLEDFAWVSVERLRTMGFEI